MLKNVLLTALIFALSISALQCGSGDGTPLTPTEGMDIRPVAMEPAGQNYLWGMWRISVDRATGEFAITQTRQSDLALNVLGFLEAVPLTNLSIDFKTLKVDFENNYIGADVTLAHPLITPEGTFHGFDVRGIVFGPEVRNADGWTAMMNPDDFSTEFFGYMDGLLGAPDSYANYTGDWFGYKYFCDGLSLNEDYAEFFTNENELLMRGIFEEGKKNSRHYDLYFGGDYTDFLVFNYAVVASYNWPTGDPPFEADDFDISTANVAEAFCCSFAAVNSTLSAGGGTISGSISIDIEIWDWQGLDDTQVEAVSDILATTPPVTTYVPGNTSKSGIFSLIDIPGEGTGDPGFADIWIVATDNSETFGSSWFLGLLSTGNPRYDDPVFTVFRLRLEIPDNTPPVAAVEASTLFPAVNRNVTFDASTSHDNESPLSALTFEWDLDGDGTYEIDGGNNPILVQQYTTEGDYTLDLRVTDPDGAWDTLDTPLDLVVSYCGEGNVHEDNNGQIDISGFSILPLNTPRFALSFLTEGPYAGQAVCQAGPYSLGTFDADSPGDIDGNYLCDLRPYYLLTAPPPPNNYQPNIPFIIDVCPVGGYILVVTDARYMVPTIPPRTIHMHQLDAYAPDGSGVVFSIRDDVNFELNAICALDCDDNGDIWFIGWFAGLSGPSSRRYLLVRIPYTGGSPPWETNINNYDEWNITSLYPGMTTDTNVIIDMAIDYGDDRIYILSNSPDELGKLSAFKINDMTPTDPAYDNTLSVTGIFTDVMRIERQSLGGSNPLDTEYWHQTWSYAGMEIDHEETDFERCRIVCYSRIDDGSGGTMPQVVRVSNLGEILDRETGTSARHNFGLNNDASEDTRHMTFPSVNPEASLWDTPDEW